VLVNDTGAYINGQRDHLPLKTFPSVWMAVGDAIVDGRIILPREVYRETTEQDDDIAAWMKAYEDYAVDPTAEVQKLAGQYLAQFPPGTRNAADPFVLAEAELRGFTVVTYEGRSFSGVPTRRWHRSRPGICQHLGIPCCTLPEAHAWRVALTNPDESSLRSRRSQPSPIGKSTGPVPAPPEHPFVAFAIARRAPAKQRKRSSGWPARRDRVPRKPVVPQARGG